MVMLNDWEPVILFNMAILFTHITVQVKYIVLIGIIFHCTANAGHGPCCTLLVTGVATPETHALFSKYDNKIEV